MLKIIDKSGRIYVKLLKRLREEMHAVTTCLLYTSRCV